MSGGLDILRVQQALGVTAQTAKLALALAEAQGAVVGKAALATAIHCGRFGSVPSAGNVDEQVRRLRLALGEAGGSVETVRGVGYRLAPNPKGWVFVENRESQKAPEGGVFVENRDYSPKGGAPTPALWDAPQAWIVAAAVASEATGVPLADITAKTRRGQRRPEAVTGARALAICLAVIGGGAARKRLARSTGFDLSFIKDLLEAQTGQRDDAATDAELERLEAEVLRRLEAAHPPRARSKRRAAA